MTGNKFIILGSSSGLPQAGRACSGYVLKTGENLSLIDCGGGVTSSFLRRGLNPLDVEQVFITHTHPDHVIDLPLFIQLLYLEGRTGPFDMYIPEEFVQPFRTFLTSVYLIEEKLGFKLNLVGYQDEFTFTGEFQLRAIGNKHLQSNGELIKQLGLPNKMQCHSVEIEVDGKKILYSSDIAAYEDVRPHLDGKDLVVLESTHVDLAEFIEHAQTVKVGRFIITHLGTDEEIAAIQAMAAKAGLDNLTTAVDGMEVEL
jgi:ribonuclease BN (tRNA processing enzyme)